MNNEGKTNFNNNNELMKTFIGNKYDKIVYNSFNFPAFFLKEAYFFYRKMYLYGFLFLIPTLCVPIIFLMIGTSIIGLSLVLSFCIGLFTNKLYLNFVEKKVRMIVDSCGGDELSAKEIIEKKGGTNLFAAIIVFLFKLSYFIVIFVLIVILLFYVLKGDTSIKVKIIEYIFFFFF